LDASVTLSAAL